MTGEGGFEIGRQERWVCTLTREVVILAKNKQNFKTVTSICLRNAIFNTNDLRLQKHELEIPTVFISIDSLATHAVRHVF